METGEKTRGLTEQLLERLHNPSQLRTFITAVVLLVGYVGVYLPFSTEITAEARHLHDVRQRLALAQDIERLRARWQGFRHRRPAGKTDTECINYLLKEAGKFPLKKVANHDSQEPLRELGPYKAVVLRLDLEGSFLDLAAFLRWLETDERWFRVDKVQIQPLPDGSGLLDMQLTVLGVIG